MYQLNRGVLLYKKRIYINKECPFKGFIMQFIHNNPTISHARYERTLRRAKNNFFYGHED